MKKKIFACLLLLMILFPFAVLAEAEVAEIVAEVVESELPTQPVSWDQLATIGGCAMMTMFIVQLVKAPMDKVWKIPTRIIVFLIALVIMLLATYFTQGLTVSNALLTVFNAVISALTAMGAYELSFAKIEKKT